MSEYQAPQNWVMDWANDQSVMDPLYETLMKKAVSGVGSMMGAGDPSSDIGNAINPMGMPVAGLISKIPFDEVTKRNFELVEALKKMGATPEYIAAVEHGVKTHPRVSAHVEAALPTMDPQSKGHAYGVNALMPGSQHKSVIGLDSDLIASSPRRGVARDTAETYGHELNHAAQRLFLGNDELMKRYNVGEIWQGGRNPLELSSDRAGTKFANKMLGDEQPVLPRDYDSVPDLLPREIGPIDRLMKWFGY